MSVSPDEPPNFWEDEGLDCGMAPDGRAEWEKSLGQRINESDSTAGVPGWREQDIPAFVSWYKTLVVVVFVLIVALYGLGVL